MPTTTVKRWSVLDTRYCPASEIYELVVLSTAPNVFSFERHVLEKRRITHNGDIEPPKVLNVINLCQNKSHELMLRYAEVYVAYLETQGCMCREVKST